MRQLLFVTFFFLATTAGAQVEIDKPWARATPPGAKVAAGYMVMRNKGASADRLVAVRTPAAARVETHVTVREGDVSRMREVKGYDIPANASFELKPGGAHLMFIDPKQPFREGDKVPAVLVFQKAGEVKVEFHVGAMGGMGAHKGH